MEDIFSRGLVWMCFYAEFAIVGDGAIGVEGDPGSSREPAGEDAHISGFELDRYAFPCTSDAGHVNVARVHGKSERAGIVTSIKVPEKTFKAKHSS
jgi:hypothetical protein